MKGILAAHSNIKIGIIMAAAGLLLLIIRLFFDIAAKVTAAKKEYAAIMGSGLISGSYSASKDTTLIETIDKNSGRTKPEKPQSSEISAFAPDKPRPRIEGRSSASKAFAPTGPLRPARKPQMPEKDSSRYVTSPLRPAK